MTLPSWLNHFPKKNLVVIEAHDHFFSQWAEQVILRQRHQQGCHATERIDKVSSWPSLTERLQHQDLFTGDKNLILSLNKPDLIKEASFSEFIKQGLNQSQYLIILHLNKCSPGLQKNKAYLNLKQQGLYYCAKAPYPSQIQPWIDFCLKQLHLKLTPKQIQQLNYLTQSQPFALWQSLMQMSQHNQTLPHDIQPFVSTTPSEQSVFELIQALFLGHTKSAKEQLCQQSEQNLTMTYWMLIKQLRAIVEHKENQMKNQWSLQQCMTQIKVWPVIKTQYQYCLKLPLNRLHRYYAHFCELEQCLKGYQSRDFHLALTSLALKFCANIHKANTHP